MKRFLAALRGQQGTQLRYAVLMGSPAFLLLIAFMIAPFIGGINLSRTNQRFDGSEADDIGLRNYDRILSINLIQLPGVPDDIPFSVRGSGWYRSQTPACKTCESENACTYDDFANESGSLQSCIDACASVCEEGELIFRWRERTLEDIGLGKWAEYKIVQNLSLGDSQYALIAKDPLFWKALLNNLRFALVVVPLQTALALLLAILVNQKLAGMNFFRTMYFSPVVTAMVIIAVVWKFLYNPDVGLINSMIEFATAGQLGPFRWLLSDKTAMNAIIIMSIWQGVGFQMIIFLAGLQDIPEDLYEASSVDGASLWQKFRHITLPMLRNTMIFVVLTTTILAFRLFDQIQVMTPDGGPEEATATMIWYAIRRGWGQSEVGYASAVSIVFVAIVLFVSIIQRSVMRSESQLD